MVYPADTVTDAASSIWEDLLRGYAEAIEQQRSFLLSLGSVGLEVADEPPPSFVAPRFAPPLPASLHGWANSLINETAGLTELATQILGERPAPLPRSVRRNPSTGGSTMDQKL